MKHRKSGPLSKTFLRSISVMAFAALSVTLGIICAFTMHVIAETQPEHTVVTGLNALSDGNRSSGGAAASFTTSAGVGSVIPIILEGTNLSVDWGDGKPVKYGRIPQPDETSPHGSYGVSSPIQSSHVTIYGNLTWLGLNSRQLISLDVSGSPSLQYLDCASNSLTSLDLSHNSELSTLICDDNPLPSLNLSNNKALESLNCSSLALTSLDISGLSALTCLECAKNKLSSLDVSHNVALTTLGCNENILRKLDVSNNHALISLYCPGNRLTSLDLSGNSNLKYLNCSNNRLTSLDMSKNSSLVQVICQNNSISSIDLLNTPNLKEVFIDNNTLGFSELFPIKLRGGDFSKFQFFLQKPFPIPDNIGVGEKIDLSSEYMINGKTTQFSWSDTEGNAITPASSSDGIFTFGKETEGKKVFCRMTNANFDSNFIITTTETTVMAAGYTPEVQTNDGSIAVTGNSFVSAAQYVEDTVFTIDGQQLDAEDVRLIVGNIEDKEKSAMLEAIANYDKQFNVSDANTALYEISLADSDSVQIRLDGGKIKVCLKYPSELGSDRQKYTFRLFHQKSDGSLEEIPITCGDDGIWFETDGFSPFALAWNENSDLPLIAVICTAAAVLALLIGGIGFILFKKKKAGAKS